MRCSISCEGGCQCTCTPILVSKTQSIIFIKVAWHGAKPARPICMVQFNTDFSTARFIQEVTVVHWAQSQFPFKRTRPFKALWSPLYLEEVGFGPIVLDPHLYFCAFCTNNNVCSSSALHAHCLERWSKQTTIQLTRVQSVGV